MGIVLSSNVTSYGCIEASSTVIDGNYTKYADWNNHSIWLKNAMSETYVIYFENNLGGQYMGGPYAAFGVYSCESMSTYTDTVDQMIEKSPALVMGCKGTPIIFCPALDTDDANSLMDGMSATDGSLDWIHIYDFYDCDKWFVYDENENYPTSASLSFVENEWCESEENDDANNNDLVIVVAIFVIFCIAAIAYFGYKWMKEKKVEETKDSRVGLTAEKEENKFAANDVMSTPLVDEQNVDLELCA